MAGLGRHQRAGAGGKTYNADITISIDRTTRAALGTWGTDKTASGSSLDRHYPTHTQPAP
jgi:hypothetical protein